MVTAWTFSSFNSAASGSLRAKVPLKGSSTTGRRKCRSNLDIREIVRLMVSADECASNHKTSAMGIWWSLCVYDLNDVAHPSEFTLDACPVSGPGIHRYVFFISKAQRLKLDRFLFCESPRIFLARARFFPQSLPGLTSQRQVYRPGKKTRFAGGRHSVCPRFFITRERYCGARTHNNNI